MHFESPYVVVLAGGEGQRLASLTRALYGVDLPKQFAVLAGERSLLQATIDRALALTSPDHISVVVTARHAAIASAQLAPYPGVELAVQPDNLDTAAGLLFPLARILARTCNARVVFLPSDHHVVDAAPITAALAAAGGRALSERIALIGVAPTSAEVEYGWIVRGSAIARSPAFEVSRFAEKPSEQVADELRASGALWNTFIQTGPVHAFSDLARRYLPIHAEYLERYAVAIGGADEQEALEAAYRVMPRASFSHAVLAHARELAVLPVGGTGWSDWGSPRRVFASLAGTPAHAQLVDRIRGDVALAS